MIHGEIKCSCGQWFDYETSEEYIECPTCKQTYLASKYAIIEPEVQEENTEEVSE